MQTLSRGPRDSANRPKPFVFIISLLLVLLTLFPYWQVTGHDFIGFDDHKYITENPYVRYGFSLEGLVWAFTATEVANWHPLTWLSHMLDCHLYGLNPGVHLFNNVLIHIANTLLLFLLLRRMTPSLWKSAFVAALFALHPLHVESVAWIAERKDVLSTLFWMLTIWTYLRYVERPGAGPYLLSLTCFALGLMAKPMVVTLPFVLLLLDYWPLRRWGFPQEGFSSKMAFPLRLIWEKVPFLVLSAISCIITYTVQHQGGAMVQWIPLKARIANALVSYILYVYKMLWPHNLAAYYPHPGTAIPLWQTVGATLLLAGLCALAVYKARKHGYFLLGWFWYFGTLVPVIGLVQVGLQKMADRYTYIPLIGLFIIIAWGVPHLVEKWPYHKPFLIISSALVLVSLSLLTFLQVTYWKDTASLFQHTLRVTRNNHLAHNNLGNALGREGKHDQAIHHFLKALEIFPGYAQAHNNLAVTYAHQGKFKEAFAHYTRAVRIDPQFWKAHFNFGLALASQGMFKEAASHYQAALNLRPGHSKVHYYLGLAYCSLGDMKAASREYKTLKDLHPTLAAQLLVRLQGSGRPVQK